MATNAYANNIKVAINMNCNNLQFSKMLNLHEKYYTIDETQA